MRVASWTLGRSVVCRSNTCHFVGDLGNCDSRTHSQVSYYAGIVDKSRKMVHFRQLPGSFCSHQRSHGLEGLWVRQEEMVTISLVFDRGMQTQ